MICIDIDSEVLPELLRLLQTIPNVAQVRCNRVLRKRYIKAVGEDGIYICLMAPKKDGTDRFIMFEKNLTWEEANDRVKHESVFNEMSQMVEDYYVNDIIPKSLYDTKIESQQGGSYSNFDVLVRRLQALDSVSQIRWNKPLKKKFVDFIGKDGYIITAFVPDKRYDDSWISFMTMVPKNVYDELSKHDAVVENMRSRIENYIMNDIVPSQNFSVDEVTVKRV